MAHTKNALTIQINSLEALERLIGGNSEIEIELRNNVAAKFAEKHIKQLAGTEVVEEALETAQRAVKLQAAEMINKAVGTWRTSVYGSTISDIQLRPEIEAKIKAEIDSRVASLIDKQVMAAIEAADLNKMVDNRVKAISEYEINKAVRAKIDAVMKGLV